MADLKIKTAGDAADAGTILQLPIRLIGVIDKALTGVIAKARYVVSADCCIQVYITPTTFAAPREAANSAEPTPLACMPGTT